MQVHVTITKALFLCVAFFATAAHSATLTLRQIVVKDDAALQQVQAALDQGWDFSTVAKRYSTAPSAGGGGFLGKLDPAEAAPPYRTALAGTSPGERTKPFTVGVETHLLQHIADEGSLTRSRFDYIHTKDSATITAIADTCAKRGWSAATEAELAKQHPTVIWIHDAIVETPADLDPMIRYALLGATRGDKPSIVESERGFFLIRRIFS